MSSKTRTIILVVILVLLLVLMSWHEGIIMICLSELTGSIWTIVRFSIEIIMTVLLGHVLSTASSNSRV
jgi:hypothetical protein